MRTSAIVISEPQNLALTEVELARPAAGDVAVDVLWTGISAGTERLLWTGRMPPFPGMGYPLVPGYEVVGRVAEVQPAEDGAASGDAAPEDTSLAPGDLVFVPGANCFEGVRGLFGGAAARLVVPGAKVARLPDAMTGGTKERSVQGILLALAATAQHALAKCDPAAGPALVVGHGALGQLLARLMVVQGWSGVTVWETNAARQAGAVGYTVVHPDEGGAADARFATIIDVSGDPDLLDTLIAQLVPGGEIVLAGFYAERLSFSFPPAFMREARLRVAAQWAPQDMAHVLTLVGDGQLDLSGLISHKAPASAARQAYETAFNDPACLKMVLDWEGLQ